MHTQAGWNYGMIYLQIVLIRREVLMPGASVHCPSRERFKDWGGVTRHYHFYYFILIFIIQRWPDTILDRCSLEQEQNLFIVVVHEQ